MRYPNRHWHVHTHTPGYLCECDSHEPLDARGRDAALRFERDCWLDGWGDRLIIRGSIRKGGYVMTLHDSPYWERWTEAWECTEPECWEGIER